MIDDQNLDNQPEKNNPEDVNIRVDIDDQTSLGRYSNLAITNYSKEEFVLDFVFLQPHLAKGRILSRIILSPNNAKRLARVLDLNLRDYEEKFGPITDEPKKPGLNISFN